MFFPFILRLALVYLSRDMAAPREGSVAHLLLVGVPGYKAILNIAEPFLTRFPRIGYCCCAPLTDIAYK